MAIRNLFLLLLVISLTTSFITGQESIDVTLNWSSVEVSKNDEKFKIPYIEGQGYNDKEISFQWNYKLKGAISDWVIEKVEYSGLSEVDLDYLKKYQINVPENFKPNIKTVNSQSDQYLTVSFFPYIKINNVIKKVISFKVESTTKNQLKSNKSIVFKTESVLKSGDWYKISVNKSGVYRLDYDFLASAGVNMQGLTSTSIHVFGNGEGKLPESNDINRLDDLTQNDILIEDGGDGIFDQGDYILFYGWGPSRWYYDGQNTYLDQNIYSEDSYYFINVSSDFVSKTISNSTLLSTASSLKSINSYDEFQIHELENYNLVGGGQRWYGDLFDVDLERQIALDFEDISSLTVDFKYALASNATSISGNKLDVLINDNIVNSISLPVGDYSRQTKSFSTSIIPSGNNILFRVTRNSPSVLTYLDYLQAHFLKSNRYNNKQYNFRAFESNVNDVIQFDVFNVNSQLKVWDVTNRQSPANVGFTSLNGGNGSFKMVCDTLREFVVFSINDVFEPDLVGKVKNQNLHSLPQTDYIIVTPELFIDQANRLADLHRSEGLNVTVVQLEQIYNEFSSGMLDPTAIRDLVRMFYTRAQNNIGGYPKYLLLFGDGTYDPKNRLPNNNNYVPTYQVVSSEYSLTAMVTDDYFGMLDDNESIESTDMLDIGVGRLLISSQSSAKQQVDKIEHYLKNGGVLDEENSCFGDWKNRYVIITDDEEYGYFINQDAEPNTLYVKDSFPEMNVNKVYCDAFQQITNAGGQRYPEVNDEINESVNNGAIVINYIGHGGEKGAAEERIITIPEIQSWGNKNKLNLFVSATCEFTKFDDPARVSAGEWVALNTQGGAIALMTTTRSVFFGVNTITGKEFYKYVFERDTLGNPLTFGEIIRLTKNASGSSDNKRSFTLIGDPALKLGLPRFKIITDSINGYSPDLYVDTIKALSKVKIKAHLEDFDGSILSSFSGIAEPTVYDKFLSKFTLGQDVTSPVIEFEEQKNVLFKGQSSVYNGYFDFEFIVPKDINFQYGPGKISYYANNDVTDANGEDGRFIVGGIDTNAILDNQGPLVSIFLNDSSFIDGGLTDENPMFYAKIYDESGVNTVGNGVGHDITLVLDGETSSPIVLNNFYQADLNTYKSGLVEYQLNDLSEGEHTLKFKVWDVNNNSEEVSLNFVVATKSDVTLNHVLNYPNPFTTATKFYFEHNQLNEVLDVQIQIFTVSGSLVKTIKEQVTMNKYRNDGISWNGLDDFGDQIGKGVYIYKLTVRTSEGKTESKVEKLFKL